MEKGKYSYGDPTIYYENPEANLIIGSFCSIGPNVTIWLGGNHRGDWISTYPFGHINQHIFPKYSGEGHPTTKGDVKIENDVWIGANVVIMSGVQVGNGAIIANNSHVVNNVEPYSIVGGNPAKRIKYRFSPEIIEKFQTIKWWEWDDHIINELSPLLCSNNFELFFEKASAVLRGDY